MADGSSAIEARHHLQQAFDEYVVAMLNWGEEIPEPTGWPGVDITAEAIRAARVNVSSEAIRGRALPRDQPIPETKMVDEPEYELA